MGRERMAGLGDVEATSSSLLPQPSQRVVSWLKTEAAQGPASCSWGGMTQEQAMSVQNS